jgi:hypothetical protein
MGTFGRGSGSEGGSWVARATLQVTIRIDPARWGSARALDADEVVYDPQITGEAVRRLTKADPRELVPFRAGQERLDAVRRVPFTDRFSALFWLLVPRSSGMPWCQGS